MSGIILSQRFEELAFHVKVTTIPTSISKRISDTGYETLFVLKAFVGGRFVEIRAWWVLLDEEIPSRDIETTFKLEEACH